MTIAEMDLETRRVVYLAHIVAMDKPPAESMKKLRVALKHWDKKHEKERTRNLIRAIFDKPDTCHSA